MTKMLPDGLTIDQHRRSESMKAVLYLIWEARTGALDGLSFRRRYECLMACYSILIRWYEKGGRPLLWNFFRAALQAQHALDVEIQRVKAAGGLIDDFGVNCRLH